MEFKKSDTEGKKTKTKNVVEATAPAGPMGVQAEIPIEQGSTIRVGDEVTMTVKGEISSIRKPFEESGSGKKLLIEISKPRTVDVEANSADVSLKQMIGGK